MGDDTPFSFHCMICFESFHPEDRYPVVLPCGHTYVCIACANRLDKCMECRTPLFTLETLHHNPNSNGQNIAGRSSTRASWSNARSSTTASSARLYSSSQPGPPPDVAARQFKVRLPLPKNVVLLSLIEATELVTEDARKKYAESPRPNDNDSVGQDHSSYYQRPGVYEMNSMVDVDDEEEEKIKVGASIAVGVAGTYAVAVREGLEIMPSRPRRRNSNMDASQTSHTDEEVDSLMRSMQVVHQEGTKDSASSQTRFSPAQANAKLSFGDRVQVVSVDGGWAKLSRGYGYVPADKYQLVKVGGTLDRACALEAMLRSLSDKRKELRQQQARIDNHFIRVMKDLQISLRSDEDLTVILASAFSDAVQDDLGTTNGDHLMRTRSATRPPADLATVSEARAEPPEVSLQPRPSAYISPDITKPPKMNADMHAVQRNKPNLSMMCFASDVFSSFDGCDTRGRQDIIESLSNSSIVTNNSTHSPREGFGSPRLNSLFPTSANASPSAMRAGAQAWRERQGRPARDGINFRTGMSGHMALLSTQTHAHQYLNEDLSPTMNTYASAGGPSQVPQISRMSSHTGLTMSKNPLHGVMGVFASLTIPSFGSTSQTSSSRDHQQVPRSGSM